MVHVNLVEKYLFAAGLEGLERKTDRYNARCPICGDSEKSKRLKRFWVLFDDQKCTTYCFNCGYKKSFKNFLWEINAALGASYNKELFNFMVRTPTKIEKEEPVFVKSKFVPRGIGEATKTDSILNKFVRVKDSEVASKWCYKRALPEHLIKDLYYTDNYMKTLMDNDVKSFDWLPEKDERVVIPFRDKNKNLTFIQGRAIGDSTFRYMTIELNPSAPKIWGLDTVDSTRPIRIAEGVFDACFVKNSISITSASTGWDFLLKEFKPEQLTMIFDSDIKTNQQLKDLALRVSDMGVGIFIWPKSIQVKDINDYIKDGIGTIEDFEKIIQNNTFTKLTAKTKIRLLR